MRHLVSLTAEHGNTLRTTSMQLMSLPSALKYIDAPRSSYYRWRAAGEFPQPDLIVNERSVAYLRSTLDAWIAQRRGERAVR